MPCLCGNGRVHPRSSHVLPALLLASLAGWGDFASAGAVLAAAQADQAGYAITDPAAFNEALSAETAFDEQRSARECFCGASRHRSVWLGFYAQVREGLAADPGFAGGWVHALCGAAYPVVFRVASSDPSDDSFSLHTDCPAGLLAMVVVCAQSAALQQAQSKVAPPSAGAGAEAPPSAQQALPGGWRNTARVVADEGLGVGDLFGQVALGECLSACDREPRCQSVAVGPHGCHLKGRCVRAGDPLIPAGVQGDDYKTYYRAPCRGAPRPQGTPEAGGESTNMQDTLEVGAENTNLQEMQNMFSFAIRTLEFCFHCLDASPWPFLLSEVLANYASAVEAPQDFMWQRGASRYVEASRDFGGGDGNEAGSVPDMDPPTSREVAVNAMTPVYRMLLRLRVRWTRGLEMEADFWRQMLSPDPVENPKLARLEHWLATGEVTWSLEGDDLCAFVGDARQRGSRGVPRILNVGSGPFAPRPLDCALAAGVLPRSASRRGDEGRLPWPVPVVAADGLARFFVRVLDANELSPLYVPTQCVVEEVHTCFPLGHFDVVHMRNSLDHAFDPLLGIERMLQVVRPGGWVLLRHARNEGIPGKFRNGLHQWAFDAETAGAPGGERDGQELSFLAWNPDLRLDVTAYLLSTGLAAQVRTELHAHPSADAPPDEKYVWVDIRRPTEEEAAERLASLSSPAAGDAAAAPPPVVLG